MLTLIELWVIVWLMFNLGLLWQEAMVEVQLEF